MKGSPEAYMDMGWRAFEAGVKSAPNIDAFCQAQALVKLEEARMWVERGLLLAGAGADTDGQPS